MAAGEYFAENILTASSKNNESPLVALSMGYNRHILQSLLSGPLDLEVLFQSDPIFRGSTRLWCLREYKSDLHHTFLVVSFVQTTRLFRLMGDGRRAMLAHS